MLLKRIEKALNDQIDLENASSNYYLAMTSWLETEGLNGVATFLYRHSDEERAHMLKLIRYINERGCKAEIPSCAKPPKSFDSVQSIFKELLEHEIKVSQEINGVVDGCLNNKDYITHNFMQWFVSERIEGDALAWGILDKLNLVGKDKAGLYLFDRDLGTLSSNVRH